MPELRKDPIVGRWVIISTDRVRRPTDFIRQQVSSQGGFCPFCYGNESKTPPEILAYRPPRDGGPQPPRDSPGWTVRVVPNKFPALGIEGNLNRQAEGMFDKVSGIGAHEVIIMSPEHTASLASLPAKRIEDVLWAFRDRIIDLRKDRRFKYILLFKNHGEAAGATLEHPHAQLIALPIIPKHALEELEGAKQYFIFKERCVYCDVLRQELENRCAWSPRTTSSLPWRPTHRASPSKPGSCPSATSPPSRIPHRAPLNPSPWLSKSWP